MKKTVYDLIIIGGGPAGVAAGIYSARQKLKTLLITKNFGGQIARKSVAIENYPGFEEISGIDLIQKFETHLRKYKIDIVMDEVIKVRKDGQKFLILTKNKRQFQSKAVIVASGSDPRPLEVSGEKELIGQGVSYCALCDGPLFKNKVVAIIGGGDAGFETATFLANYVRKIYILETLPQPGARRETQEMIKKTGKVQVITDALLKEIRGDKFVNSIVYEDKNTKKEKTLRVEGVFVEIGSVPAVSFVKDLVDFNEKDEIVVDPETSQARTPGLFAAGDVDHVPYKQIVIACGEGAKAALSAYQYLQKSR